MTDTNTFLQKLKKIYKNLLLYIELDNGSNIEDFQDLNKMNDKSILKCVLHLLSKISSDHNHTFDFDLKIENILIKTRQNIKLFFTNFEIFNIFKNSRKLLYFLIKKEMLTFDEHIEHIINNDRYSRLGYPLYFYKEMTENFREKLNINSIDQEKQIEKIENLIQANPQLFDIKRKKGQNDSPICDIIRSDSVNDFVSFATKNNISYSSIVQPSVFETNSFLIKHRPTLIEYSVFVGSIEIFKFLYNKNVEINPSIWLYAVHSQKLDLIQLFEEYFLPKEQETYQLCLFESIKCHHNELAHYFLNKCELNSNESNDLTSKIIKSYNFEYFPNDLNNEFAFYNLCKYDYPSLVDFLIHSVDINKKICRKTMKKEEEKTALQIAVEKENFDIVQILLTKKDIDMNCFLNYRSNYYYKDELYQCSALHIAVSKENIEIINLLLSHEKIDENLKLHYEYQKKNGKYKNTIEKTALYLAVEKENIEIIKLLLSCSKIDPNIKSISQEDPPVYNYEKVPLHLAIEKENLEIIKLLLLSPKIDVNIKSVDYCSSEPSYRVEKAAIHIAVEKRNKEIVDVLLSTRKIDLKSYMLIKRIKSTYTIDKQKIALHIAIKNNDINIVECLLKEQEVGINVKEKIVTTKRTDFYHELSPLHIAIKKGFVEIIKLCLLRDDIDINDKSVTKEVKNFGFNEIEKKKTALHIAIDYKKIEIIRILLMNKNIDVNAKASYYEYEYDEYDKEIAYKEKTAFLIAIEQDNLEIVKLLAEQPNIDIDIRLIARKRGINIATKVRTEKTALQISIRHAYIDIIDFLLSMKKINVNDEIVTNEERNSGRKYIIKTALINAVENGDYDVVNHLLCNELIDVNSKFIYKSEDYAKNQIIQKRKTSLHIAVKKGYLEIVNLLLSQKNIDINEKCVYIDTIDHGFVVKNAEVIGHQEIEKQKTALHIAVEEGNIEIVKSLISHQDIDVNVHSIYDIQINNDLIEKVQEKTALHLAIEQENYEMVECLLNCSRIDVNAIVRLKKNEYGTKYEKFGDYIFKGIEVKKQQYKEKTGLIMAVKNKNITMAKILLSKEGIDVNSKLIKKLYRLMCKEKTPLIIAIENDDIEMVKLLLEQKNIDVNANSLFVVKPGEEITIKNKKEKKQKSETNNKSYKAMKSDLINNMNLLIKQIKDYHNEENEKNKKINPKYEEYRYEYSEYSDLSVSDEDNYDISYEDSEEGFIDGKNEDMSENALHLAVQKGNIDIIKELLNHKEIDIHIKDAFDREPLEMTNDENVKALFKTPEKTQPVKLNINF